MLHGPSAHLSWRELASPDGVAYPVAWRATRGRHLGAVFETIRLACGARPLRVTSGYRTPRVNRGVGGARHSQHLEGRALDLAAPAGLTAEEFYHVVRGLIDAGVVPEVGGVGRYRTHLHVDVRPSSRLVVWRGPGVPHV